MKQVDYPTLLTHCYSRFKLYYKRRYDVSVRRRLFDYASRIEECLSVMGIDAAVATVPQLKEIFPAIVDVLATPELQSDSEMTILYGPGPDF